MNTIPKYFDIASTTPVDNRVLDAMLPYFSDIFGNANSNHIFGKEPKLAITEARHHVSRLINADHTEIIFTSGATEAINFAIKGYLEANPEKGDHIITVKTEHKAVLKTCEYLETKGYEVTYLDVDNNGLVSLEQLERCITPRTTLISVMYANNEIGIIQDIRKIGEIANKYDVVFFCDATQAVGKVPVDVVLDKIDMLCLSAHKFFGPKGIGALYVKNGLKLTPLIHGGGQENGLRGGTYNTPLIVGIGKAAILALEEFEERSKMLSVRRELIEAYITTNNFGLINFKNQLRVPHIISVTIFGDDADDFLIMKSQEFVASTGSACNTNMLENSHVTRALRMNNNVIRISFSHEFE